MKMKNKMKQSTILFVDDQDLILTALKRAFLDEPYEKIFVSSGKEALEILEKRQVHVIVADLGMPDMDGSQLLKTVRAKYPDIVRIVLSGQSDVPTLLDAVNESLVFRYITKPWKFEEEFKPAIRDAIELSHRQLAETGCK